MLTVSVVVGRLGPTVSLLQTRVGGPPAFVQPCKPEHSVGLRSAAAVDALTLSPLPSHATGHWCCAVGGLPCGAQHQRPLHSDHDQQGEAAGNYAPQRRALRPSYCTLSDILAGMVTASCHHHALLAPAGAVEGCSG